MALIERKWLGEPGACFWSFGGLFLVTGVVSGVMLIVYLVAFVYKERDELRAAESSGGSMSMRRLHGWLQHYDRKDTRSPIFYEEIISNGTGSQIRAPGRKMKPCATSPLQPRAQ
ncbi:hypothetical protein E2562_002490 [Oryza meyeriana var. granulata]|uniref:Uncharacterized protein n=1 Tax=Oryza meyeriana var. granulata TaxID=110450 RepID=A0A6G1F2M7_9ORYZ|nr:hypothetical protein E2562_002490 [Oryza meyeriana var. granulata]